VREERSGAGGLAAGDDEGVAAEGARGGCGAAESAGTEEDARGRGEVEAQRAAAGAARGGPRANYPDSGRRRLMNFVAVRGSAIIGATVFR
jgi:hypothetical protein